MMMNLMTMIRDSMIMINTIMKIRNIIHWNIMIMIKIMMRVRVIMMISHIILILMSLILMIWKIKILIQRIIIIIIMVNVIMIMIMLMISLIMMIWHHKIQSYYLHLWNWFSISEVLILHFLICFPSYESVSPHNTVALVLYFYLFFIWRWKCTVKSWVWAMAQIQ